MNAFQPRASVEDTPHAQSPDLEPSLPLVMTTVGLLAPEESGRNKKPGSEHSSYGTATRSIRPTDEVSMNASQASVCNANVGVKVVLSVCPSENAMACAYASEAERNFL